MITSPYLHAGASDPLLGANPLVLEGVLARVAGQRSAAVRVTLAAPRSPGDVLALRNSLARGEAADAGGGGGGAPLDAAAALFGGGAAPKSKSLQKAVDAELLVYGNLAFASCCGHQLLIIGSSPRIFVHFQHVAYIVQESDLGIACQFAIILSNKQEYKFSCNSSAEYLQWIECLQRAYKASHHSQMPTSTRYQRQQQQRGEPNDFGYDDFDDRRSLSSQTSYSQRQHRTPTPTQSQFRSASRSSSRRSPGPGSQYYNAQSQYPQQFRPQKQYQQNGIMRRQPAVESYYRNEDLYGNYNNPQYRPSPFSYYGNSNSLSSPRSMPDMSPQHRAPSSPSQRYYETEFDYSHSNNTASAPRGRSSNAITNNQKMQQKSKSVDRFYRSTRPTKLDMDDLYSNDDEYGSSPPRGSGGGGSSQYPQRSMSAPRMGNNNSSNSNNNNNNSGRQSPEMNMQQLYELTVNAYKAGLADEFDNDERDVRDRGRFHKRSGSVPATSGVSPRAGYPTRAGSLVRFTGEDEVAYDLQRMSSDGSNHSGGGARRAESLQRYNRGNNHDGEEDGDDDEDYRGENNQEFEEDDRAKYQNHQGDYQDGATTTGTNDLQLASRMTSTPMMQKSVTVDGRYGSGVTNSTSKKPPSIKIPYAEQVVAQASSSSSSSKQGGLGISTDTSGRSKSMDPRLRSPSVESRRSTTSPAALVKSVQQQQSLFSVSGFRSSNPYGLFEDEAAKRKREAAEKAASGTGTPVTAERKAVPSNDKAKQYLLATLFGSGPVKMPTIPRLGSNDSAKRGSGPLQQKGNGSPTISETSKSVTTTTVTSTSSVGEKKESSIPTSDSLPTPPKDEKPTTPVADPPTTTAAPSGAAADTSASSATTASSSYTVTNKTDISHLRSPSPASSRSPSPTKSISIHLEFPPMMSPIDVSSVLPPSFATPPQPPVLTQTDRDSSNNSTTTSHPPMQMSTHIDLLDDQMVKKLEEMRVNEATVKGLVGATASSLGFYDDAMNNGGPEKVVIQVKKGGGGVRVGVRDPELEDSDSSVDDVADVGGVAKNGGGGKQRAAVQKTVTVVTTTAESQSSSTVPKSPTGIVPAQKEKSPAQLQRLVSSSSSSSATSPPASSPSPRQTTSTYSSPVATTTKTTVVTTTTNHSTSPTKTPLSTTTTPTTPPPPSGPPPTTTRTRSSPGSNTRMSANIGSLHETLMQSLQSSPAYQKNVAAQQRKSDREKVILAAAALTQTLQKMEPVVLSTPPPSARGSPVSVLVPADSGGDGVVRSAIGAFEGLRKELEGAGAAGAAGAAGVGDSGVKGGGRKQNVEEDEEDDDDDEPLVLSRKRGGA